ncbi:MAG: EAL domain-containing protein [Gammaproteobacteria bacterium]|nr:EAL domain-containing protein [Gammaproteobacteria bacterium]
MTQNDSGDGPLIYVGIGASAGGLEAIREFTKALEPSLRLTFLIAQHLSPSHTSMLVDLIRRECDLAVNDAVDGGRPKPNEIYITPPNRDIEIRDGRIRLSEARTGPMPKPDINRFFRSLAEDCGSRCIGMILSGTGTDGAAGMIEIKSAGGITIAQDPKSAKYDGMPLASIHADAADLVMAPSDMAATLQNFDKNRLTNADVALQGSDDTYTAIVDLVLRETGVNLLHYKKNSIQRRIRRRMSLCNRYTLEEYIELLHNEPQEIHDLARDAFIGVTGFFRDPEAFDALAAQLSAFIEDGGQDDDIRIWVPGCATGEEAYTIAVLMEEYQRDNERHLDYRIFATDIGTEPLKTARLGTYSSDALSAVDAALIGRYFRETANGYSVIRRLRDHVVFSTHDLTRDAPFSKLDLISCRNVMIYFDNELQRQVFDTFHYALRAKGLLMLGMSESNAQGEKLFAPIDAKARVYRALDVPGHRARIPHMLSDKSRPALSANTTRPPLEGIEERLHRQLAGRFGPASAVINQGNEIMYSYGDLSELMTVRSGPASLDILSLVNNAIRSTLRALLYKVRREASVSADTVEQVIAAFKDSQSRRILVTPFDPNRPGWLLISFQPIARRPADELVLDKGDDDEDAQLMMALEHELLSTRESLQTVVEELETTNEELQAANEELQSSNEEFQSTNEELQTTNEELQSSNEELLTLNDELQEKTRAYESLANQLQNIQNSIDTPLIVVDNNLRVTRYVPNVEQLVPLSQIRDHDHITALPWRHEPHGLREALNRVIDSHQAERRIMRLGDKVWQLHASPFIDDSNRATGAVLVFTDSSELYESQERFRQEKERAQITLESIGDGVLRVDVDGKVEYVNPVAAKLLGWDSNGAVGSSLDEVLTLRSRDGEPLGNIATKLLAAGELQGHRDGDCVMRSRDGRESRIAYTIGATTDHGGEPNGAVIAFRDMTDHHETLDRMSWISSHDDLTGAVNRREMERRISTALNAIQQGRKREAVFLFLDLDQFKVVNDSCGHLAGDELLKQVTRILRDHTRHRDTLGRLGGDEFGVLLEGCVIGEAEMVAEKIRSAIADFRFHWQDKVFRIGISIGIVALTPDSGHVTDVLSNADSACYAAKERGRNRIQIHTPDDDELARQRADLHWVSEITDAMENDRLRLYMQQIRTFRDDEATHWEALLRMFNRKGKLLLPGTFLPAAERYGLIQQLDEWVIDKLFHVLHQYRPANGGSSHPYFNVNLSGASFTDARITDHVHRCLDDYEIDPSRVTFEITETAAISNMTTAKSFIARAKDLGCRIALDDFGSGMSSFKYLKELDVDYLKIDGGFVKDIETDPLSQSIVRAMVEIAQQLDIRTVAEFALTETIVDKLQELGVCCVQGHAVGDPLSLEAFLDQT